METAPPAIVPLPFTLTAKAPSIGLLVGNRYALDIPADFDEGTLTRLIVRAGDSMLRMPATKVYLAPGVTDMRAGIDRLSVTVQGILDLDPFSGHLFVFCNRRRDAIKVLYWDRNGFCLWHKRLEKHRFCWPERAPEVMSVTPQQLGWLLDGLTLTQQGAHQRLHYKSVL